MMPSLTVQDNVDLINFFYQNGENITATIRAFCTARGIRKRRQSLTLWSLARANTSQIVSIVWQLAVNSVLKMMVIYSNKYHLIFAKMTFMQLSNTNFKNRL